MHGHPSFSPRLASVIDCAPHPLSLTPSPISSSREAPAPGKSDIKASSGARREIDRRDYPVQRDTPAAWPRDSRVNPPPPPSAAGGGPSGELARPPVESAPLPSRRRRKSGGGFAHVCAHVCGSRPTWPPTSARPSPSPRRLGPLPPAAVARCQASPVPGVSTYLRARAPGMDIFGLEPSQPNFRAEARHRSPRHRHAGEHDANAACTFRLTAELFEDVEPALPARFFFIIARFWRGMTMGSLKAVRDFRCGLLCGIFRFGGMRGILK